jgi:hypothetical protein
MLATNSTNDDTSISDIFSRYFTAFNGVAEIIRNMSSVMFQIFNHGYSGQGQVFSNICTYFEHDKLKYNKRNHIARKQFMIKPAIIHRTSKSMIAPYRYKSWKGKR